ncbi:MAG: NUDIX domain-containing protein [Candidatus Heimdallarchaeota archaeon]|nr:NUDIX domain-containing protein [Candidatus Heimdallarchaeota archaeon]MCK4770786.1 NUDIX domain-containing protein [Candidatus Heimdallarchaeota archaeon]
MSENTILNVVIAGIQKNDKWLFIRRTRGDYQQKWALVGGKMCFDEEIEDAIIREIREETGLEVKWLGVKAVLNEILREKKTGESLKHFLIILCHTSFEGGSMKETKEGKLGWFSESEIERNKEDIIPSDFFMFKNLLKGEKMENIVEIEMFQERENLEIGSIKRY